MSLIEYYKYYRDIEASRRQVSCHQDRDVAALEPVKNHHDSVGRSVII